MINIELTNEEAVLFRKFREHQDTFSVLDQAGVFDIRNGKAVLNFDSSGTLCDIECNLKLYKRGMVIVPLLVELHHNT